MGCSCFLSIHDFSALTQLQEVPGSEKVNLNPPKNQYSKLFAISAWRWNMKMESGVQKAHKSSGFYFSSCDEEINFTSEKKNLNIFTIFYTRPSRLIFYNSCLHAGFFSNAFVLVNEPASWFFFLLLPSRTKPIEEFLCALYHGVNKHRESHSNEWNKENQPLDIFHCTTAHHTLTVFVPVSNIAKKKYFLVSRKEVNDPCSIRSISVCYIMWVTSLHLQSTHTHTHSLPLFLALVVLFVVM